ncbi:MAG: DUF1937 family protein [Desulfovibrionaceae bacterium]
MSLRLANGKNVYLATPYTHHNPAVREARYLAVSVTMAALMRAGFVVYSPITQTHHLAHIATLPVTWEFWEAFDRSFLEGWAQQFAVLDLPGRLDSLGVTEEYRIAQRCGLVCSLIEPPYNALVAAVSSDVLVMPGAA